MSVYVNAIPRSAYHDGAAAVMEAVTLLFAFGVILGMVVLVHELGHFAAARAGRVQVSELGLGLPPRLARLGSLAGTQISLNWIPLGGFVRPAGEFDPSIEGGLAASAPLTHIGVLAAGSLANLALSVLLMASAFMAGWPDQVEVLHVEAGSPAEEAGLRPGDRILVAADRPIRESGELRTLLSSAAGSPVRLEVQRAIKTLDLTIVPRTNPPEGQGPAGFTSSGVLIRYAPGEALRRGAMNVGELFGATVRITADALIPGEGGPSVRLASPLGLKQASDQAVRNALAWEEPFPVLYLAAWLSLAVAMTNLLPFPALDGGRILFVLIEVVQSRPIEPKREKLVHAAGMVGLLALLLALAARDFLDPLF